MHSNRDSSLHEHNLFRQWIFQCPIYWVSSLTCHLHRVSPLNNALVSLSNFTQLHGAFTGQYYADRTFPGHLHSQADPHCSRILHFHLPNSPSVSHWIPPYPHNLMQYQPFPPGFSQLVKYVCQYFLGQKHGGEVSFEQWCPKSLVWGMIPL